MDLKGNFSHVSTAACSHRIMRGGFSSEIERTAKGTCWHMLVETSCFTVKERQESNETFSTLVWCNPSSLGWALTGDRSWDLHVSGKSRQAEEIKQVQNRHEPVKKTRFLGFFDKKTILGRTINRSPNQHSEEFFRSSAFNKPS